MADEITLQFLLREPAAREMQSWRDSPPDPIRAAGLELVDQTLETLIYEGRYMDWPMKVTRALSLGLFGNLGESVWKLSVRFDPDGEYRCRVTATGKLDEQTRAALGQWAAERGEVIQALGVPATAP
jgi:hypothetical protein